MDIDVLLKGILLGFSIAAPVGPIGVLCIRRTLAEGRIYGLFSGLGAATADMFYGCLAGFGLTFITNILIGQQMWLRIIGGAFLCYLGVKTFLAAPVMQSSDVPAKGLAGAYFSTFLLTLSNPMTIISFTAVFAGLGVGQGGQDYTSALQLVAGVFMGSAAWWLLLSGVVGVFRARFNAGAFHWVNRISGTIILGFGILALTSLFL